MVATESDGEYLMLAESSRKNSEPSPMRVCVCSEERTTSVCRVRERLNYAIIRVLPHLDRRMM